MNTFGRISASTTVSAKSTVCFAICASADETCLRNLASGLDSNGAMKATAFASTTAWASFVNSHEPLVNVWICHSMHLQLFYAMIFQAPVRRALKAELRLHRRQPVRVLCQQSCTYVIIALPPLCRAI